MKRQVIQEPKLSNEPLAKHPYGIIGLTMSACGISEGGTTAHRAPCGRHRFYSRDITSLSVSEKEKEIDAPKSTEIFRSESPRLKRLSLLPFSFPLSPN